jgi:hypothetical protein
MKQLRRTRDITAACEVTRAAVAVWREMGMPYTELGNRDYIYDASEVLDWLQEHLPKRAEQLRAWEMQR